MTPVAVGLVLAAGEGRRLGGPKALVADAAGQTWLARAVAALHDGGVADVTVVVGAAASMVRGEVPAGCRVVEATDWADGMAVSLGAGLAALAAGATGDRGAVTNGSTAAADAVIVMLVDTPGVGAGVIRRLADLVAPRILARAAYQGQPGHPVLIGRDHWAGVRGTARGDRGARDYLSSRPVTLVECSDIGSGADVDTPELLAEWRADAANAAKAAAGTEGEATSG